MHTVTLVGMGGHSDFLCFPHFDSPTIFAALLRRYRARWQRPSTAWDWVFVAGVVVVGLGAVVGMILLVLGHDIWY